MMLTPSISLLPTYSKNISQKCKKRVLSKCNMIYSSKTSYTNPDFYLKPSPVVLLAADDSPLWFCAEAVLSLCGHCPLLSAEWRKYMQAVGGRKDEWHNYTRGNVGWLCWCEQVSKPTSTRTSRPRSRKRPASSVMVSSLYMLHSRCPTASTATPCSASPPRDCTVP